MEPWTVTVPRRDVDVLVVGGGVVGVCAAYYLAAEGRSVVIAEKAEINAGSSYGNAGLAGPGLSIPLAAPGVLASGLKSLLDPEGPLHIKPRPDLGLLLWLWRFARASTHRHLRRAVPLLRDLGVLSRELFDELVSRHAIECQFARRGNLAVFFTSAGHAQARRNATLLQSLGVACEVLDGDAVRGQLAMVAPGVTGGIRYPSNVSMDPARFVDGVARAARGVGVEVCERTEVLGVRVNERRVVVVETNRGELAPRELVLAAGAWTPRICKYLGIDLTMEAAKGYSVTVRAPDTFPELGVLFPEDKIAAVRLGDALRLAGALELAGMDDTVNRRRVDAIIKAAGQRLPGLPSTDLIEVWRGLRPCTPDGLPQIGRPTRLDNVVVATGHGMLGLSLGPGTGRLVAQMVGHRRLSVDVSLMAPER